MRSIDFLSKVWFWPSNLQAPVMAGAFWPAIRIVFP
jgi:hypothetical protein